MTSTSENSFDWLTPEILRDVLDVAEAGVENTRAGGIWPPRTCVFCGKFKPCPMSNVGPVCGECVRGKLQRGTGAGKRVMVPPPMGTRSFVMKNGKDYLTVHGTLYAFERQQDAEKALAQLEKEFHLKESQVEEEDAILSFLYCLKTPELKMQVVKWVG